MRALLIGFLMTMGCLARAELPAGVEFFEREVTAGEKTGRVTGVIFRAANVRMGVVDNPNEQSLGAAMRAAGAIAGVNGGYFHPDRTPLGLVIADGNKLHAFERAKLLSGIFVVTKGRPRIVRAAQFTPSAADSDALQAGPFLVEKGLPVPGLNAARPARRTVVATDGKGRWALLMVLSATLAETAALLSAPGEWPDFPIAQALNLDGGSSTGLWVNTAPKAFYSREFGTVRNFLAVRAR